MTTRQTQSILVLTILGISVFVAHPVFGVPHDYEVIIVGALGDEDSYAYGINDYGQVVGESTTEDGYRHAFLWEDGVMTDLGVLGVQPKGLETSRATSISNSGDVVGYSWYKGPSGEWVHAFLWESGQMRDLGTLGGINSYATAINNRGQIIGYSTKSIVDMRAFLWDSGTMIDIGTLEGGATFAYAINDSGQVVGASAVGDGYHVFLWGNGEMSDLGTFGWKSGYATGINNRREIIGVSFFKTGSYREHSFLWKDGVVTDLGALEENFGWSHAAAINDSGQVVGTAEVRCSHGSTSHAWLWENGEMFDLHNFFQAGVHATRARNINHSGHIVGYAEIYGTYRGFIMIPVIEADTDIDPDTVNLANKGKWVTCYIWLGEDYDVGEINPDSILLEENIKPAWIWFDEEAQVAMAKFKRSVVQDILYVGELELTITGELMDGTVFKGTDIIKVLDKAHKKK